METKKFHLGDVLSVTMSLCVSPRNGDGLQEILEFMTDKKISTDKIPVAMDQCKPYLLRQFPYLNSPEIIVLAYGELVLMLERHNDREMRYKIILGWLSKLISGKYGIKCEEMLNVMSIPEYAR